jgi:hypothetical protein
MPFSDERASGDPGAFGMLDTRQERILRGPLYHLEAIIAQQPRRADEWS